MVCRFPQTGHSVTAVALLAVLLSAAAPAALAGNKNKLIEHDHDKGYYWEIVAEEVGAGYADIIIYQGMAPSVDGKQHGSVDGVHLIALVSDYTSGEFQEVKFLLEDSELSSKNLRSGRLNVKKPVQLADSTKQLLVELSWECDKSTRSSSGYRSPRSIFWLKGDLKITACNMQKIRGKIMLGDAELPVRNVLGGSFK